MQPNAASWLQSPGVFDEWRDRLVLFLKHPFRFIAVGPKLGTESGWHAEYTSLYSQLDIHFHEAQRATWEVSVLPSGSSKSVLAGTCSRSPVLDAYFQEGPILRATQSPLDLLTPFGGWVLRMHRTTGHRQPVTSNLKGSLSPLTRRDLVLDWKEHPSGKFEAVLDSSGIELAVPDEPFGTLSRLRTSVRGRGRGSGRLSVGQARVVVRGASCSLSCLVLQAHVKLHRTSSDILPAKGWVGVGGRTDMLSVRGLFSGTPMRGSIYKCAGAPAVHVAPGAAVEWQDVDPEAALERCHACHRVQLSNGNKFGRYSMSNQKQIAKAAKIHESCLLKRPQPLDVEVCREEGADQCRMRWLVRPLVPLHRLAGATSLHKADVSSCCFAWRVAAETCAERSYKSVMDASKFVLLTNSEDAEHGQPPSFSTHLLRPEQLRSLRWMVDQERSEEPFVYDMVESITTEEMPLWRIEGRARCSFGVPGGVLADKIGYGKTAITIGLIDVTATDSFPRTASPPGLFPSCATLILAPTNLHAQWVEEIKKFTGCRLRVLSLPTCTQLKQLKVRDLQEADVVVVTYRLFYSAKYLERLAGITQEVRKDSPRFSFPPTHSKAFSEHYKLAVDAIKSWSRNASPSCKDLFVELAGGRQKRAHGGSPSKHMCEAGRVEMATPRRRFPDLLPTDSVTKAPRNTGRVLICAASQIYNQGCGLRTGGMTRKRPLSDCSNPKGIRTHLPPAKQRATEPPLHLESVQDPGELVFPPLEAFFWKRIVCDEFHELLRNYPPWRSAIPLFHSQHRWGLSGTPPCNSVSEVQAMAEIFRIALPPQGSVPNAVAIAQEWLDRFVRQNTIELEQPPVSEEVLVVQQSPSERALYLRFTQELDSDEETDRTQPQEVGHTTRSQTERLLKLCSHFQLDDGRGEGSGPTVSAEDQCQQVVQQLYNRIRTCEQRCRVSAMSVVDLKRHLVYLEPGFSHPAYDKFKLATGGNCEEASSSRRCRLKSKTCDAEATDFAINPVGSDLPGQQKDGAWNTVGDSKHAVSASSLATVDVHVSPAQLAYTTVHKALYDAEARLSRQVVRSQVPKRFVELCHRLQLPLSSALPPQENRMSAKAPQGRTWAHGSDLRALQQIVHDWTAEFVEVLDELLRRQAALEAAIRVHRFFLAALKAPAAAEECGVCLEKAQNAVLPCAHTGCYDCLHRIASGIGVTSQCPFCRTVIGPADVLRLVTTATSVNHSNQKRFAKYGSKIQRLVEHLNTIWQQDADARVIIFVQWEDLKEKLAKALTEFGMPHLVLQGGVWARRNALANFRAPLNAGHPRVLLLSLEESASGTNLTEANHVVLVHPMYAVDRATAVAFEMQAIGRVARPGQTKHVRVWRFVTADTIEAEITKRHRQDLWARRVQPASAGTAGPGAAMPVVRSARRQRSGSRCTYGESPDSTSSSESSSDSSSGASQPEPSSHVGNSSTSQSTDSSSSDSDCMLL